MKKDPIALLVVGTFFAILSFSGVPAAPASSQIAPTPPPVVGDPIRLFDAQDLNGRAVDIQGLLKGKVGVVTFWATWCQPCIQEIPQLRDINRKYRDQGLVILGIGMHQGGDTPALQRHMAARQLINYLLLFDHARAFETGYALKGVPHNVIVGRDGKIRWQGPALPDDLESRIKTLLAEESSAAGQG